ncbi:hypothetical protein FRC01_002308, partial [Tulasnella sp. 417]
MEDDIVFRGEGPCDVFLRRVRKVAFEKGKHKDGDWMAGYASTCFEGEALMWYEGLDEDVQDDWKRLRAALLERFPLVSEQSARPALEQPSSYNPMNRIPTAPAAPQTGSLESQPTAWIHGTGPTFAPASHRTALKGPIPAPAAAPPPASSTPNTFNMLGTRPNAPLRGRLAVISDSPETRGYVGKLRIQGCYDVTASPDQALRVEYTPSENGQPVDFRLLDSLPETDFDRLGMVWHSRDPRVAAQSAENSLSCAVRGLPSERKHSAGRSHVGPVGTTVWSLRQDGSVYPVWKTGDQNYHELQTVVLCDPPAKRLLFAVDWDAYVARKIKDGGGRRRDKA